MKVVIAVILALSASPSFAAETPYLCRNFVEDYTKLASDPAISSETPVTFQRAASFILGAFYAFTGAPFGDGSDPKGLYEAEQEIIARCAETPNNRTSVVALDVIRRAQRTFPDSSSFSPDPEISLGDGVIEYDEAFGLARLTYQVASRKDHIVGVSVRCGLYDENGQPLGQSGGWVNGIPPGRTVIGEGLAQVPRLPVRADCRIITVNRQ